MKNVLDYRPRRGSSKWKFTVVNNASTAQNYTVMVGTSTVSSVSLTATNTAGSFRIHKVCTTGTLPNLLLSTGQSLFVQTAKGNEIYNPTGATFGLRQLAQ